MKVRFFQKLNTRLSIIPLIFILVFLIIIGLSYYFLGYGPLIKDFYKPYIINLTLEKKIEIDLWLDSNIKKLEELSNLDIFKDSVLIFTGNTFVSAKKLDAEAKILSLFEEKVASEKYHALSLLSKDGVVLLSTKEDLINEDLSYKASFKEVILGIKSSVGFDVALKSGSSIIDFMSPLTDANRNVIAILHASLPLNELAGFLKIKETPFKSLKIEIIDKDGIILTKDGIFIHKTDRGGENFSYALNLKNTDMMLVSTIYKYDALMPFNILLIAYFSLIGIIIVSIVRSSYLAKKLITKPISNFLDIVKSLPKGKWNADFGGDYKGEILQLKESFKKMLDELKIRESYVLENARSQEKSRQKSMLYGKIAYELRQPLSYIVSKAEVLLERDSSIEINREDLWEIWSISRNLFQFVDDLSISSILEEGKLSISAEEFNICELLKDIEECGKKLIGEKEIELIVDCQDVLMNKAIYTDRQCLRQVIINLLINAIKSTEEGTITILCSEVLKYKNRLHIEIIIADTGKGIKEEMINDIFEEFTITPLTLSVSKRLVNALGGKIEVSSSFGKGSVFTVTVPIKENIHSGYIR